MHPDIKEILFTHDEIVETCKRLGKQIDEDYAGKTPLLVGLLRGSVPFIAELIQHITVDMKYDFMDVSSYEGTESTGEVRIIKDLDTSVKGVDIILIDDIADTGYTLDKVAGLLYNKGANSVRAACLLNKAERRKLEVDVDYIGFEVPNVFVVGFGLDYEQLYRNLPYIGILKEEVYQK